MYSGITQGLFEITSIERSPGLLTYRVLLNDALIKDLKVGASISIDGVCQTVVQINHHHVTLHAMAETLAKTTLGDLCVGRKVSVERSLRVGDEIGGHELAGHIFEMGKIIDRNVSENNLSLVIECSPQCIAFIFEKGFIGLDGSSLTVGYVNLDAHTFAIHLIPETLRLTNFGEKQVGEKVNVELDARMVAVVETVRRILQA